MAKNLRVLEDGSFVIKNVILSYPHLFEKFAKAGDDPSKARYGAVGLLDKKEHAEEIAQLKAMLVDRQKTKFKKKLAAANLCLRDGDESGKPEYEGKMSLSMSDKKMPPNLLDRDGKRQVTEKDDKLYAGAVVNLRGQFWDQDNAHGQKINCNLIGVQFMAHGDRFSSVNRPKTDETFESEGEAEDGGDDGFGD